MTKPGIHNISSPSQPAIKRRPPAHVRAAMLVALTMMFTCAASPAFANAIRLHDEMGVTSETVKLSQVAELSGEDVEALGETVVGRFDNRNEIFITLDDVRGALDGGDLNWAMVTMRGHRRCRVIRLEPAPDDALTDADSSQATESAIASNIDQPVAAGEVASLRGRVEAVIAELAGEQREDLRIEFRHSDQRRLSETTWNGRFEVEPRAAHAVGRVPLTVRRYRGGQPLETFTVTADVQRRVNAVVAKRNLGRGDRFGAEAVELREVWLDDQRQPLADTELVIGQQAASTIRPGSIVYPDDVRSPVLVKRGELVTVRAVSGSVVVRTVGRAAEAGAMDETIRVRNEGSRETFHATVTGRREAVVILDNTPASHESSPREDQTIEMNLDTEGDSAQAETIAASQEGDR